MFWIISGIFRIFIDIALLGAALVAVLLVLFYISKKATAPAVKKQEEKKREENGRLEQERLLRRKELENEQNYRKMMRDTDNANRRLLRDTENEKRELLKHNKALNEEQLKNEKEYDRLFAREEADIRKAFDIVNTRIQKDESGRFIGNSFIINRLVADRISALLKTDVLSGIPESISKEIWMSNAEYIAGYTADDSTFVNVRTDSPRKDIPGNLAVRMENGSISKDDLWATQVRLLALKNFIDNLQAGRQFIEQSDAKDYNSLLEYIKESGIYRKEERKLVCDEGFVNGIVSATKYNIHAFDFDSFQNWVNEVYGKYKNLENQFKEILYEYKNGIAGKGGEDIVNRFIEGDGHDCLFNINIPKDENHPSAEVDAIWFRPEGIFVIETKNMNGTLEIDEDMNVTGRTAGGITMFEDKDDPIVQCERHCDRIKGLFIKEGRQDLADAVKGIVVSINPKLNINNRSAYPVLAASFLQSYVSSQPQIEGIEAAAGKGMIEKYASMEKKFRFHVLSIDENPFITLNKEMDKVLSAMSMDTYLYEKPVLLEKRIGLSFGDLHMSIIGDKNSGRIVTSFNSDTDYHDPGYQEEIQKLRNKYNEIQDHTEEEKKEQEEQELHIMRKYMNLHYGDDWYQITVNDPDIIYNC